MRGRISTVAIALAALAALVAVPAAMAAYTSPKLEVTQTATGVVVKASLNPNDDPTARVGIIVPAGTQLTTSQAPGAVLGPVKAIVKALDLAGADLPLEGQLVVAAPGQVPASTAAQCTGGVTPLATWVMVLSAAGQTLQVPTYLVPTSGALAAAGPAYIAICLPPPDVPVGTPGRATFGAKVYSAELAISGVFSRVATGAWISTWVPYTPGAGAPNAAGAVVSPAGIAPGAVTISARISGRGAIVSGSVTQGGQPRGGATVTVLGGSVRSKLTTRKRVRVGANGRFTTKFATGTFFRADAVATGAAAPPLCAQLQPLIGATPCVNPTVNGFTAKSAIVRKRK
jgi:hypothetical protein